MTLFKDKSHGCVVDSRKQIQASYSDFQLAHPRLFCCPKPYFSKSSRQKEREIVNKSSIATRDEEKSVLDLEVTKADIMKCNPAVCNESSNINQAIEPSETVELSRNSERTSELPRDSESVSSPPLKRRRIGEVKRPARTKVSGHASPLAEETLEYLESCHRVFLQSGVFKNDKCEASLPKSKSGPSVPSDSFLSEMSAKDPSSNRSPWFNQFIECESESVVEISGRQFVVPGPSSFLMSDISNFLPLLTNSAQRGFNLVVADPPWHNKSVKRSKRYKTINHEHLLQMPVRQLLDSRSGGYVAIWVTNDPKLSEFVKNTLLPKWGCAYYGTWYWLKVCDSGELVMPFRSTHRNPFEQIIIGKIRTEIQNTESSENRNLPKRYVICSVPSVHSRKPFLGDIFRSFLSEKQNTRPRCLELFARNLHRHWTSWGNEVLKFQRLEYFQKK
eukprot:985898_1